MMIASRRREKKCCFWLLSWIEVLSVFNSFQTIWLIKSEKNGLHRFINSSEELKSIAMKKVLPSTYISFILILWYFNYNKLALSPRCKVKRSPTPSTIPFLILKTTFPSTGCTVDRWLEQCWKSNLFHSGLPIYQT